jgi:hypothetical protein
MDVPAREATHRWLQARDEYVVMREADPHHIGLRVHLLLQSLGTYLIPMLFGLLGTISFMLRRLIQQISDYTYLGSPVSLNLMRCGLGMIGGVVGTLVMGTNDSGPLKSLPPLALPFVFGYGVEIVFAGLDRVVSSFTTVTKQSPGK